MKNKESALKLLSDLNITRYTDRHVSEIIEFIESGSTEVTHLLAQLADYDETDAKIAQHWLDDVVYKNNNIKLSEIKDIPEQFDMPQTNSTRTSPIDEIKVLRYQIEIYMRLTQSNINMLIKTDKQMAKYFQEDLDTFQKDTGITDEMLYGKTTGQKMSDAFYGKGVKNG